MRNSMQITTSQAVFYHSMHSYMNIFCININRSKWFLALLHCIFQDVSFDTDLFP